MSLAERTALIDRVIDGRYRVVRHLADGGMGSVYAAVDQRLERDVALKVMREDLARNPSFVERFRKEARSAARLSDSRIVVVHDQGEDGGVVFLAMELVEGMTLREWLTQVGALTPREALGTIEEVLGALSVAHRAGIVHRDVKPENVLISIDGVVKVADFGLARAVASSATTGLSGTILGTVAYLAPEQVERGVADARSDVYAAGLMLHEMLTGRPAIEGSSPIHVAFQHVHGRLPAPSEQVPALPAALDELVAAATTRDPDDRPADAGAWLRLVQEAREALTDAQLDARPPRPVAPSPTGPSTSGGPATSTAPAAGSVAGSVARSGADGGNDTPQDADASGSRVPPRTGTGPDHRTGPAHDTGDVGVNDTGILSRVTRVLAVDRGRAGPASQVSTASTPALPSLAGLPTSGAPGTGQRTATLPTYDGVPPEAPGRPRARVTESGPARPRRRRALWVAVVAAAVIGGVGWYWGAGPGSQRPVPSVVGAEQLAATTDLQEAGLRVGVQEAYSETVAKGAVIATDPVAGAQAWRWSTVTLRVSRGPERYTVPDVTRKTPQEAEQLITAAHLRIGATRTAYHESVAKDLVIGATPKIGTELRPGANVTITVSKGREPIELVDWTGKPADEAATDLREAGLLVTVTAERFDDKVKAGAIISQTPAPGTLYRGDTVAFVVSKGPDVVTVPNVRGKGERAARSALEAAGFRVRVETIAGGLLGIAHSTDPAGGKKAPNGSTIVLRIV